MTSTFNHADLFEIAVDVAPERIALIAGDTRLTYRELEERANRVAHHLALAGIVAGDRVSILAHNRAEWLEAQIAVYKLRAVPVNVSYRYTANELAHVLGDSESAALIGERELIARLGRAREGLEWLHHVVAIEDGTDADMGAATSYEEALAAASADRDFGPRSGDDLYLLYTGGTTGKPKGVMWRQEDIFFTAMGGDPMAGEPLRTPEDVRARAAGGAPTSMVNPPLMHGAGMWGAWGALIAASTLVLWSQRRFDPDGVLRLAAAERVAFMLLAGDAMARPLADRLDRADYDLSALTFLAAGGSATSPDVKRRLHQKIPSLVAILDGMGGSETGACAAGVDPSPEGLPRFRPRPEVAVLDEKLLPIEPGSDRIGVLAKTGRLPSGYWNDREKTAATFVPGPDGRRWALQGDMARLDDDGCVVLLGRGSLVINTGGEKVFVEEVEAALKSHPAVYDAVVVGLPDERLGSRVAAVVSAVEGVEVPPDELIAHCRKALAGYKVPRDLRMVTEVIRTPTGKADYAWARKAAAAR
ncbi:MAG: AMP-dependent synthetase and ligase [Nocardia sp.]|uniref:acyl-CoA synthetase n=1 Tax=Nocardia sp. TaxID=1821 RepID=UPI00261213BC|nr:acyl-CoA synthetase [Nocardia sp.]MCU1641339.1 AMP-dependent synthetase and ligase [Nocardia sp.]